MSSARIYANPIVGRTGLANMLFVWARAEVFCQRYGASMLAPQWVNVFRVGPWFRFERDKRYYFANFSQEGMVHGLKRFVILRALRHVDESVAEREGEGTADGGRVVDFRGMAHFFDPFWEISFSFGNGCTRSRLPRCDECWRRSLPSPS